MASEFPDISEFHARISNNYLIPLTRISHRYFQFNMIKLTLIFFFTLSSHKPVLFLVSPSRGMMPHSPSCSVQNPGLSLNSFLWPLYSSNQQVLYFLSPDYTFFNLTWITTILLLDTLLYSCSFRISIGSQSRILINMSGYGMPLLTVFSDFPLHFE